MQINFNRIMNEIMKIIDEQIKEDIDKDIAKLRERGVPLEDIQEKLSIKYSNDTPFAQNISKGLIFIATSTAILEYHHQLRIKLFEYGIDIGDLECDITESND